MSGAYRDRIFGPADARRILRKAAELQDAEKRAQGGGRPLTFEELARVAADAGISPANLQRAMLEGGDERGRPPAATWSWTGGPATLVVERTIDAPITPESHGRLVKVMRRAIGELGNPQTFGDSLSWSTAVRPSGGGRTVTAVVEPSDRGTLIRVEENLWNLRGVLFGGILGGVGGGCLGIVVPLVARALPAVSIPLAVAVWGLALYAFVRRLYGARARAREVQLHALAETLVEELGGTRSRIDATTSARVAEAEEAEGDGDAAPAGRAAAR